MTIQDTVSDILIEVGGKYITLTLSDIYGDGVSMSFETWQKLKPRVDKLLEIISTENN